MTNTFTIEIRGEALKMLEARGVEPFREAIKLTAFDLKGNLQREAPIGVTGDLHNQFYAQPSGMGLDYVVGNPLKYAADVNDGRGPHTPNWDSLDRWAKFKGIPTYPVYRSIKKKGTKANPFVDRAMARTTVSIDNYFNMALAKAGL